MGSGSFGHVWRARERERGIRVAIKVVKADVPEAERGLLLQEARAVSLLDHPGIVRVVDLGTVTAEEAAASDGYLPPGAGWMAMDLLEGGTVRSEVGQVSWPRARALLLELLDALAHAHAHGLVHRDLKPANVLFDRTRTRVVLTDFGLSGFVGAEGDDIVRGTPAYMAPEQVRGDWREMTPATDLYSLGCFAWALVTGQPPFGGSPRTVMLAHLRHALPPLQPCCPVPEGFEAWLGTLLRKDPSARPAFAADAARALVALPGGGPIAERDRPRLARGAEDSWAASPAGNGVVPPDWRRRDAWLAAHLEVPASERLIGLRSLRMVGRTAERDRLWAVLGRVVSTRTSEVVVLRGPSGLGKSRLAAWLAARAHEAGAAATIGARFDGQDRGGLGAAVARDVNGAGLDAPELLLRLRARLGDRMDEADLAALAELAAPGTGSATARLAQASWRQALLRRWVGARAADRPVVLVLDDAHGDPEALRLAAGLVGEDAPRGVLLLITVEEEALALRPDAVQAVTELEEAGATVLRVGPLDDDDQEQLVRGVLGLAPRLAAAVVRRTAGHPLFAEQLVGHWLAEGALVATDIGLDAREDALPELPPGLSAVWGPRVARLLDHRPDPEGQAVELAATLGMSFSLVEWRAACARAGVVPVRDRLDALVGERFLLRIRGGAPAAAAPDHTFAHAPLREAILDRARARGRLAYWHSVCAEVHAGDARPEARQRRAQHLYAAGAWTAAVEPLRVLAVEASDADRFSRAGELAAQRRACLVHLGIPDEDPRWGDQLNLEAGIAVQCGQWRRAQELIDRALEEGWARGWKHEVARATGLQAVVLGQMGRTAEAMRSADAALRAWRRLGQTVEAARVLRVRGDLHTALGELPAAESAFREAAEVLAAHGDDAGRGRCALGLSLALRQRGQIREAIAELEVARGCFGRSGNRWGEAVCVNDLADLHRLQGDRVAAEAGYREACARYLALGVRPLIPDVNRAVLLAENEEHGQAVGVFDALVPYLEAGGRAPILVHVLAGLLRSHLALGHLPQAESALVRLEALLAGEDFTDPELADVLGDAARRAGAGGHDVLALRAAALEGAQRSRLFRA